jgi:co-chaperonin GroES (HSP10)
MMRNLVGVEKLGKASRKSSGEIFAQVEATHNVGVIRYLGVDVTGLKVGSKVYVGNQREEIRMNGADIMVMEVSNIIALVEDSNEETKEENSESPKEV